MQQHNATEYATVVRRKDRPPPPGGGRSSPPVREGTGGGDSGAANEVSRSWHGRHPTPDRLRRSDTPPAGEGGKGADTNADRIAKVMARAGLCSRRDAEAWIAAGRVA